MSGVCKDLVYRAAEQAEDRILAAVNRAMREDRLPRCELPEFGVEFSRDPSHGDFAANVALTSTGLYHMLPGEIARAVADSLDLADSCFSGVEIADSGLLLFTLRPEWFARVLQSICELGPMYGHTNYGSGKKVMVEFVSAGPARSPGMSGVRGGVLGDCLAAVLSAAGYDVKRECYINDAGGRMESFALSLEARYLQLYKGEEAVSFPEDGFPGEDIALRAREFAAVYGDKFVESGEESRRKALVHYALPRNIDALRENLMALRIHFNTWFHESALHEDGAVDGAVEQLREKGLACGRDGALWYRPSGPGGGPEELLVRADGRPAPFAADLAYHWSKFAVRGFETVINVWDADRRDRADRLKEAADALGLPGENLEILLLQPVRLLRSGEPFTPSGRAEGGVTLPDLLELVPVDAARFFLSLGEPGAPLDFDLDLAGEQTDRNPLYCIQRAHARICGLLEALRREEEILPRACTVGELLALTAPEEQALIRCLARYPQEIVGAAVRRDPARLARYAAELAALFHRFDAACRVLVAREPLLQARLCLCLCTRTTLANALDLMKVTPRTSDFPACPHP